MEKKKKISGLLKRAKIYKISEEVILKIIKRDKKCIYCQKVMKVYPSVIGTPKNKKTIEHLSYKWNYKANEKEAGICCGRCNASKSNKKLKDWFKTEYCLQNSINQRTVAKPVRDFIKNGRE